MLKHKRVQYNVETEVLTLSLWVLPNFDAFRWPLTECLASSFQKKTLFTERIILLVSIKLVSLEVPRCICSVDSAAEH